MEKLNLSFGVSGSWWVRGTDWKSIAKGLSVELIVKFVELEEGSVAFIIQLNVASESVGEVEYVMLGWQVQLLGLEVQFVDVEERAVVKV